MSTDQSAIALGTADTDTPVRNAVVHLQTGSLSCSATLVTSTLALTAVHCNPAVGNVIRVGLGNPSAGSANVRALRTVTKVWRNLSSVPMSGASAQERARDVAVLRFSPPVTMDASPYRPTLVRPTLSDDPWGAGFEQASLSGGIAGYGLDAKVQYGADGGTSLVTFPPATRQFFESGSFGVHHASVGGGYGLWIHSVEANILEHEPRATSGDSGGPLYRRMPSGARDILGVFSYWNIDDNWICPEFICGAELATQYYADLTAPAMKAWLLGVVDPNGDGRWEGETDYERVAFGTPGCDVAANPSCDPGCDAVTDPDCDLVRTPNDNCPNDYNADQLNSDDPGYNEDRTSAGEPGDACDVCATDVDNGDNCNADAEVLAWGPRPWLREDDVVGSPVAPGPAPVAGLNASRYRGDACDPAACMDLARRELALSIGKYGKPAPLGTVCTIALLLGGKCAFTADARIARDGRVSTVLDGLKGDSGYRFCRCTEARNTQAERIANCILAPPGCARTAAEFLTHANSLSISPAPAFPAIAPGEAGTKGDAFTAAPKATQATFDWAFEKDMLAITGQPAPPLPLTDATAASIAIDGLLVSNVRSFPFFESAPQRKDLAFNWLAMELRVGPSVVDAQPLPDMIIYPGWWLVPCKAIPDCAFGFSKPWLAIPPPLSPVPLMGAAPDGMADASSRVSNGALATLQGVFAGGSHALVPAAEHHSAIVRRDAGFAPRVALVDLANRTFLGAVAQTEDGRVLPVRGRVDTGGAMALQPSAAAAPVKCPFPGPGGGPSASVATLSALESKLFVFEGGPAGARFLSFDLRSESWAEVALSGALPSVPLAATYSAQAGSLFVLGRSQQPGGLIALSRVRLDGRVETVAQGFGFVHNADVFLTAAENGDLVLSVARKLPHAPFRVVRLRAFQGSAKVAGTYQAKGKLLAAPFLTERALHLAVSDDGEARFVEAPPSALVPPSGVGIDVAWK